MRTPLRRTLPYRLATRLALAALASLTACGTRDDRDPARTGGATSTARSAPVRPSQDSALPAGFPADTAPADRPPVTPEPATAERPPTQPRVRTSRSSAGPVATSSPAAPPDDTGAGPDTGPQRDTAAVATASPTTARPALAAPSAPDPIPPRPFAVGERLTYDVRFGPIRVGQASMEVVGIEQLRGRDAYHTRFLLRGGTAFYRVNDRYESWFDARTLESLRYHQQIDEGSYERERLFEIYPERGTYMQAGQPEPQPTVADPLDDGSFLYFLRTIPLEVGRTYEFNRYFRPDRNPVRVTVLRRERVRVPAGTFDAIVVRPTIKTTGIFSEGGRAEVWFADDSTRRMLQMKSRLSFGTLNLYLRRVEP